MTDGIIAIGMVDHSICLYTFSHFGPPSLSSECSTPLTREHTMGKLGHLNLCVVPETTSMTVSPSLVGVSSLQQDSSSALPDPKAPFIGPPNAVVEDSTEDIHLLSPDNVNTPVIPPTLGIPFQDPCVYFFEHQLSLLVTPHPSRVPL